MCEGGRGREVSFHMSFGPQDVHGSRVRAKSVTNATTIEIIHFRFKTVEKAKSRTQYLV